MQKKIIALAIASALTVPALAFAEASVSGQINMSIDMKKDGAVAPAVENSTNNIVSNQSRLIIKGTEDLGGGLSAMYQLDNRFNADAGSATNMFDGNTYLGLQGGFGSVKLGNLDTPFKSSTRNLDVFFDVAGDNRAGTLGGLMGNGHDVRLNNSLVYTSPSMSGLTVSVGTVFGAEGTTSATVNKGSDLSLAATYKADAIYAAVAIDNAKAGDAGTGTLAAGAAGSQFAGTAFSGVETTGDESKAFRLGGGYSMDAITVNAVYETLTYTSKAVATAGDWKNTNIYVAGKFAISSTDSVRAAITMAGATKAPGATLVDKASQLALGYEHGMSKSTSVYATYMKQSGDTGVATPSNLSFGMKHAF